MASLAPTTGRSRYGRALGLVLAIALAASALLAVVAGRDILAAPPVWNDQPRAWARVALFALALFALLAARFPRHAAPAATAGAVAVAAASIGVGAVAAVGLMLLASYVAGSAMLDLLDRDRRQGWPVATLIGVALAIGAFEATRALRIHYAPVHAGLAFIVIVAGHRHVRGLATSLARWMSAATAASATERLWIVIAGVVAVVHIVVAAKPEVGYDASTMHLQFAEIVAAEHRFRQGVDRYLWATMPLGADYGFATAFLLGGESAARTLNLAFGALACALVYRLARSAASREMALAATTLFASMPLATLETGSLFSETLWVAFLVATLVAVVERETHPRSWLPALALVAGGAMATKAIGVVWVAPLVACAVAMAWKERARWMSRAAMALIAVGIAIGAWPYVAAWAATGNPVFPFMNGVFRSPLYETAASFNNPAYNAALAWSTPWQLVLHSERYLEGRDGAAGLAWLFAYPLVAAHFLRRRPAGQWAILALAALFFVVVYRQQSYLRYLLPAFAALAALSAMALSGVASARGARWLVVAAGIALVAFDIRNIAAGHYPNATPCTQCMLDARARERYVLAYAPLRAVAARLDRELPDARVGFMLPNEAAPAGYVGASRSGNWHDDAFFRGLVRAPDADALVTLAQRFRLTHVVVRATADPQHPAIAQFAQRHATPLWRIGDYVVASVRSGADGRAPSSSAADPAWGIAAAARPSG